MKKINIEELCEQIRIKPDSDVDLSKIKTDETFGLDEEEIKDITKDCWDDLLDLQEKLYAEKKHSLLVVFQAMDAAGKDSTIRKLSTRLNAQGCVVSSFGKPTKLELAHDFLWRVHDKAPPEGNIALFNRSHYEDVLIVKVHGWCEKDRLERRYRYINYFESLLADNDTQVIKFMLHVSPEYQLQRFKSRLDNPGKHWKFNPNDLKERKLWKQYMGAFEDALNQCSTDKAPWYVIPAENRWLRDYLVASVLKLHLEKMNPQYPAPDFDEEKYTSDSIE